MNQDAKFLRGQSLKWICSAEFRHENRIKLSRTWSDGPRACVIGCNPSKANAHQEDPTTLWLIDWFWRHGFGGYDLGNLYPFCTSSPKKCREIVDGLYAGNDFGARDALHYQNLPAVIEMAKSASQVFVCWGAIAWDNSWIEEVVEGVQGGVEPYPNLWCWGLTKSGAPKHPMARGVHRITRDQPPVLWRETP